MNLIITEAFYECTKTFIPYFTEGKTYFFRRHEHETFWLVTTDDTGKEHVVADLVGTSEENLEVGDWDFEDFVDDYFQEVEIICRGEV